MSHANSEFHGERSAHGGEERRVGVLGWIFTVACLWLTKRRVEGLIVQAEVGKYVFNYLPSSIFTNQVQCLAPTMAYAAL